MELCRQTAKIFSTCSKAQYAALLVNDDNHLVGFGYNGTAPNAKHCVDGFCPRAKTTAKGGSYDNCYSVHAEQNAFLHSDFSHKPTKLYVNGTPCFTCAKLIRNSTIKEVYYIPEDRDSDKVFEILSGDITCYPIGGTDGSQLSELHSGL